MPNEKITAIIVAAGNGTRMGGVVNKVFMPLGDGTVIDYTIKAISECNLINNIVLVTRECDILESMEHIKCNKKHIRIVKGGKTRQESVYMGLCEATDADYVVIHDGARALITHAIINSAIEEAKSFGASAVGISPKDTLKTVDSDGFITSTIDRNSACIIQTPQVFLRDKILKAHEMALKEGFSATDDCAVYEKYIGKIKVTPGSYENLKLTTPEDLIIFENILRNRKDNK